MYTKVILVCPHIRFLVVRVQKFRIRTKKLKLIVPEAPSNVEMIVPSAYNFLNKCTIISFKGLYDEILYYYSKTIASLLVSKNKLARGW